MNTSSTTIATAFFDSLWPLILEDNASDIKSENTSKFFVPERKFDNLWAHSLLAGNNFGNYDKPLELRCAKAAEVPQEPEHIAAEIQQLPYRTTVPPIIPLDRQLAIIEHDVEVRQKLAYDFANRTFPWYIQRPSYEYVFTITEEMRNLFKAPFDYDILHNIKVFRCSLMIIDVAVDVGPKDLERWLKFSPYVAIVAVVHCPELYRKIRNFGNVFMPILMEDNLENSWQDELNRAVRVGLKIARQSFLFEDSGQAFVFVFSNNRDICTCDKFKILRKL